MPKSDYLEPKDGPFVDQMITFKNAIGAYATLLGLTPAQVTAQAADADYMEYVLKCLDLMRNSGKQWTSWKDLVRDGGTPPATGMPMLPTLPTTVPAVALGIEARFRALVADLKVHPNYNDGIGQALGIEGAIQTGPDMATLQPILKLEGSGGMINIRWGWQGNSAFLDMIELQVDRNDGKGWVLLAMDTTPNYTDTFAPTAAAKWTYRGIYRVGDNRVGQWSNEVSINVAP
ncbi:MAG TPA: hypothetical protein VGO11_12920 [Chthoniobacteraceae bacterium]|jgi:hypothetical protein|nr:hypothetical protein [Chthoniobacteraceae bacterium]